MLNALSVFLHDGDVAGQARAMRSLEKQGFIRAAEFTWSGGKLAAWAHPGQRNVEDCKLEAPGRAACCIGPIWFRGRFGVDALAALVEEVAATGRVEESALRGNFALFLQAGDQVWLLNDGLGLVRIHSSADGCFFSTSWLATCAYAGRVELNEASAIEYVLLGAAHSRESVAKGVHLLPRGHARDLKHGRTWQRFPHGPDLQAPDFDSPEEATATIAGHLGRVSAEVASAFPGRVHAALSGGFDSRAIVAGMLAAGIRPRLFVYGGAGSSDVAVARSVADAMDLELDVIDKSVMDRGFAPADSETLVENALFFDGLPNDGICDPGTDRQTRLWQSAEGAIALNGGGGEIFRNFFHLPDRRFGAGDIVRTFYRGFSPGVFRGPGGLSRYEARLAASMSETLGLADDDDTRLTRRQVELLYPLFRCHYWMGLNNSVAVRHGYYATPLVDPELVRMALRLPLQWKNAGIFESRLITALHPGIAALATSHGFRPDDGPDRRARMAEWMTCARPVGLRPLIGAARRQLRRTGVAPGLLRRYREMMPGEWCMDPLLDLGRLADDAALGRALAVEVVWRRIL